MNTSSKSSKRIKYVCYFIVIFLISYSLSDDPVKCGFIGAGISFVGLVIYSIFQWDKNSKEQLKPMKNENVKIDEQIASKESDTLYLSWKEDNFEMMVKAVADLYDFVYSKTELDNIRNVLDRMMGIVREDDTPWNVKDKIYITLLADALRCYQGLGYDLHVSCDEELGLLLLAMRVSTPDFILDYSELKRFREICASDAKAMFKNAFLVNQQSVLPEGYFFFYQLVFERVDKDLMSQYMVLMYRFSTAIAKADNTITPKESEWLASLMTNKECKYKDDLVIDSVKEDIYSDLDPYTKEAARAIIESQAGSVSMIQRRFSLGYNRAGRIMDELEKLGIVGPAQGSKPREVLVREYSEEIFRFNGCNKVEEHTSVNYQEQLSSLIGLLPVKEEIEKLASFIKIMKVRERKGLPVSNISYHCVFTGNPGTGKTTVARIVANIYKELGVIKKGHLVETDRSGLVAEYVGQTAVKTNKIIDSALDGVLFIDEAYSLVNGSSNDYGSEAISTLLKRMEDDRKRLVVILAGYDKEMKTFIDSNPGLQSRFNRYIDFPDYSSEELFEIYKKNLDKHQYALDAEAEVQVKKLIRNAVLNKDENFGNARFVRNLFERTLENQATRLAVIPKLTSEMLCTIIAQDIPTL